MCFLRTGVLLCDIVEYFRFSHNFILYRVAFTSDFGSSQSLSGRTGIWQLNEQNLVRSKLYANELSLSEQISTSFGINVSTLKTEDLQKPLVNAVVACLLIEVG